MSLEIRTFRSFSCSISPSLALHADQYEEPRIVPTAISHRNTSAVSTTGLSGEYSCTETRRWGYFSKLFQVKQITKTRGHIKQKERLKKWTLECLSPQCISKLPALPLIRSLCKPPPAAFGRRTAGICISRSVSFFSQTILYSSAGHMHDRIREI
jgi:hypothetical protein